AALVLAPALVLLGALAGTAYGLARRVAPRDAARLADRAFGLADRVATALEWADHPDRTPLVDALVADTVARVLALEPRQIVRRVIPLEAAGCPRRSSRAWSWRWHRRSTSRPGGSSTSRRPQSRSSTRS